jgi:hypothetical protein
VLRSARASSIIVNGPDLSNRVASHDNHIRPGLLVDGGHEARRRVRGDPYLVPARCPAWTAMAKIQARIPISAGSGRPGRPSETEFACPPASFDHSNSVRIDPHARLEPGVPISACSPLTSQSIPHPARNANSALRPAGRPSSRSGRSRVSRDTGCLRRQVLLRRLAHSPDPDTLGLGHRAATTGPVRPPSSPRTEKEAHRDRCTLPGSRDRHHR